MPNHPLKPGGRFFRFRNGVGGFYWKGMATRRDLGAQEPDQPRLVLNGRYFGGHIVARPPLGADVASVPLRDLLGRTAAWIPMFTTEHHSYAGVRIWWGAETTKAATGAFGGGKIGFIDTDWDNEYADIANYYHAFDFTPPIERFANFIYVGDYEALRRVYRIDPMVGGTGPEYVEVVPADEVVVSFPGFRASAILAHEGRLFYVLTDPAGVANGAIYSWDGFQSTLEYNLTVSGNQGVAMASFLDRLVVTVRGLGSIIHKNAAGTWATATVGGFDSSPFLNSMAAVKDKLYIASGSDKIYSWTGSTLALARTVVGTGTEEVNCLAAFNGRLYYAWGDYTGAGGAYGYRVPHLGVFDPDTVDASYIWHDTYKSWASTHWGAPLAICSYRQRLMLSIGVETTDGGSYTLHSNIYTHAVENNPYSTWYAINSVAPSGPVYVVLGNPMITKNMKVM